LPPAGALFLIWMRLAWHIYLISRCSV
jgi:hypothetical protein